jgi:hypothetical protein
MKSMFLIFLLPFCGFAMDRMSALSMLETADNDRIVGKAGEISRYQIKKDQWHSVTGSRNYTDPSVAKGVAKALLEKRTRLFVEKFGRLPNDFEFYGLWNAPSQVLEARVSRTVASRCERFANLCEPEPLTVARTTSTNARRPLL